MRFSNMVVILATLSQALSPAAHAAGPSTMDKAKAFICQNFPNDPGCPGAVDNKAKEAAAKAEAAKLKAQQDAAIQAALDEAAAKKAAKEEAAKKIAAEQAEAKKKAEAEKVVIKTEDDTINSPLTGKVTITSSKGYQGPTRKYDDKKSAEVFQDYCDWNGDLNVMPSPDYNNKKVARAAEILGQVNPIDFYFYGGIRKLYQSAAEVAPAKFSGEEFKNARLYLTQLCGEFRDRPEMIEDKVRWISRMVRPGAEDQEPIDYARILKNKATESIWTQMSGHTYNTYLRTSSDLWEARKKYKLGKEVKEDHIDEKLGEEAEIPVKPTTICETKFIIGEVIINKSAKVPRSIEDMRTYNKAYGKFSSDPTKCDQDDKDYLYNFRGDANLKHYSPESNAMIWHALSIARFCKSPTESNGNDEDITDETCKDYFTAPFLTRYNAARSGLASWLLYDNKYMELFVDAKIATLVLPKFGKNVGQLPFVIQANGKDISTNLKLSDSTLQFNEITGLDGEKKLDLKGAYDRLRGAVDRHTNWYQSKYFNVAEKAGDKPDQKDQAYSPFVASSYEMSKSDEFAGCGYTVPCGPGIEKHKAWMFVFKVHKKNWYNTNSLAGKNPVDFDKYWLDETSFGIEALADAERAFDRLGTAIDGEYAEMILLDNLEADGSNTPFRINPIK